MTRKGGDISTRPEARAVSRLGHGHPDVIAALYRQLDALAYAHTAFFTSEAAERLADRLIEDAPRGERSKIRALIRRDFFGAELRCKKQPLSRGRSELNIAHR